MAADNLRTAHPIGGVSRTWLGTATGWDAQWEARQPGAAPVAAYNHFPKVDVCTMYPTALGSSACVCTNNPSVRRGVPGGLVQSDISFRTILRFGARERSRCSPDYRVVAIGRRACDVYVPKLDPAHERTKEPLTVISHLDSVRPRPKGVYGTMT